MVQDTLKGQSDAVGEIMKQQSIARLGRAEEVAAAALCLGSPGASYVVASRAARRRRLDCAFHSGAVK